jgi:CrcB protein
MPGWSMGWAILLVFLGGAVGSMWRYWWSGLIAQRFGETFPFGTLVVNLVGSTIVGVCAGLLIHISNSSIASALQQLLVFGICGGLTTFSSFSLQTYNLIADGRWLAALSNIVFSTGLSFGCVTLGWQLTQGINF